MAKSAQRIGRFDQVKIITTKNVSYLSAPVGTEVDPKGIWSVVAVLNNNELLCVRRNTTIRIPIMDVFKITSYDLSAITGNLGNLANGQSKRESGS